MSFCANLSTISKPPRGASGASAPAAAGAPGRSKATTVKLSEL